MHRSARVTDDTRIAEAVPTLRLLADAGARVVACSHLGRPKGAVQEKLRLTPVAERLSQLVERPVVRCAPSPTQPSHRPRLIARRRRRAAR